MSAVTALVGAFALLAAATLAIALGLRRRGRRSHRQGQAEAEARAKREIIRNVDRAATARRRMVHDDSYARGLRRRFTRKRVLPDLRADISLGGR